YRQGQIVRPAHIVIEAPSILLQVASSLPSRPPARPTPLLRQWRARLPPAPASRLPSQPARPAWPTPPLPLAARAPLARGSGPRPSARSPTYCIAAVAPRAIPTHTPRPACPTP